MPAGARSTRWSFGRRRSGGSCAHSRRRGWGHTMSIAHRRSPIGIEIGALTMNAVQLDASCKNVLAAATIARTPTASGDGRFDAQEAARLESILYRHGFVGAEVVACVPD